MATEQQHREGLIKLYDDILSKSGGHKNRPFQFAVFTEALRKLKETDIRPKKIEEWVIRLEKSWSKI